MTTSGIRRYMETVQGNRHKQSQSKNGNRCESKYYKERKTWEHHHGPTCIEQRTTTRTPQRAIGGRRCRGSWAWSAEGCKKAAALHPQRFNRPRAWLASTGPALLGFVILWVFSLCLW